MNLFKFVLCEKHNLIVFLITEIYFLRIELRIKINSHL